jgi:hypothetical protein
VVVLKVKKPRRSEIIEYAALVAGCLLLVYFTCRTPEGDAGAAPRASRTFSAARSEPESVADTADAPARRRAVEEAVRQLIESVALGQTEETYRADAQRELVSLLERWHWGTPENRSSGAAVIVQQIFDRAKVENRSVELSAQQLQAIAGVAGELSRELLLLAVGSSPGADGIAEALPAGVERVTWNQLGGFPYREGGTLPPEVLSLQGHPVGIFGFMLTLGDSEAMREFVLVESLWGCCFGAIPDVNQTIIVRLAPDANVDYSAAPLLVTGRLEVGEERQGGFVTSLYRIVDARVRPADTGGNR